MERDCELLGVEIPQANFNSHAHVERDSHASKTVERGRDFNSHAHVERDVKSCDNICGVDNFNSHAHVERDKNFAIFKTPFKISTHTLTWSVTLDVVYIWCLLNVMRTYFFI